MKEKGWEIVYKKHGDLYPDIMPRIKKYAKIFRKHKYKKILDLGCGTGRNTLFFAQEGFLVYALDASKTGIAITKKKAKKLGLQNINYKVEDTKHTSYPDNFFDAIICIFVLSHGLLKDNQEAVDEIYRILKPKGMLVTEFMSIKDARKKGFGKLLMNEFTKWSKSKKATKIRLGVRMNNKKAISLYKKIGFGIKHYEMEKAI